MAPCEKSGCKIGDGFEIGDGYAQYRRADGKVGTYIRLGYIAPKLSRYEDAMLLAEETHPAWSRCSRGVKGLHARNINQCLGKDLDSPVSFVICWAKPKGDDGITVQGGTNTCVQLAYKHRAKIFNLYYPDVRTKIEHWIKEMEE